MCRAEVEVCVGREDRGKVMVVRSEDRGKVMSEVMPNRGAGRFDEPQIDFGRAGVLGWRRREWSRVKGRGKRQ